MKYLCGKCIHFDVCYVPRSIGCVEICGHYKAEPKEPMTEQEYLQTCNTEQLAEALLNIMANNEFTLYLLHTEKKSVQDIKCAVVEWLKQPHHNEVEK